MVGKQMYRMIGLACMGIVCISGQAPRKQDAALPSTGLKTVEVEPKKEVSVSRETRSAQTQKSAAQRSMEPRSESAEHKKSAAARAVELEKNRPALRRSVR